jgi:hypothetical protein
MAARNPRGVDLVTIWAMFDGSDLSPNRHQIRDEKFDEFRLNILILLIISRV